MAGRSAGNKGASKSGSRGASRAARMAAGHIVRATGLERDPAGGLALDRVAGREADPAAKADFRAGCRVRTFAAGVGGRRSVAKAEAVAWVAWALGLGLPGRRTSRR